MIVRSLKDFMSGNFCYYHADFLGPQLYVCLCGLFPSGSIKFVTALGVVEDFEQRFGADILKTTSMLESSSGNLAVAMGQICKERGYHFTAVIDPLINAQNVKLLETFGVRIERVTEKDFNGGYLHTRLAKVRELLQTGEYLWVNQYGNPAAPQAHYNFTAPRIVEEFPDLDYIFVGAGTCGTLTGIARYFKKHSPKTKVIAVDVVGSVIFGGDPKSRKIPGMGSSRVPENLDLSVLDDIIWISEKETVEMAKEFRDQTGILLGGSSNTVIAGVKKYLGGNDNSHLKVVCISPDFGEKYVDIYLDMGINQDV